jgi:porin
MMHATTAVADGRRGRIGSSNLNVASWIGNSELDAVIEDVPVGPPAVIRVSAKASSARRSAVAGRVDGEATAPGARAAAPAGAIRRISRTAAALGVGAVSLGAVPASRAQAAAPDLPPIVASFSYTGELLGNAAGGARRAATVLGVAGAELTVRLRRLLGWRGARAFFFVLGTHGGSPSELVGDVQGVSNLEAPGTVRLEEAWLQQNLLQDRLSLLLGRYDLNTEFYRLESAALFMNSSFGIGPEFGQSGVAGPSIFPNTAVGARVEYDPGPAVALRVAVLDGAPVNRPGGAVRVFAPGDGALLTGEAVLVAHPDTTAVPHQRRFRIGRGHPRPYDRKLALGGWHYTARFPDLTAVLPNGDPVRHRGSGGLYVVGDGTLWRGTHGSPRALTAFAQLGLGDGRVNQVAGFLGAGLALSAPIAGRGEDEAGLGMAAALNGSRFERAQTEEGGSPATEAVVEATYLAQLREWLAAQVDVQYVSHPGGTRRNGDALVLGLRIAVSR